MSRHVGTSVRYDEVRREFVAQTVCLLYRRLAVGKPELRGCSNDSQVANLRHGRLPVCATPEAAAPFRSNPATRCSISSLPAPGTNRLLPDSSGCNHGYVISRRHFESNGRTIPVARRFRRFFPESDSPAATRGVSGFSRFHSM